MECSVVLTEPEVERLAELATKRRADAGNRDASWWLFAAQVGLGFLVALLAVVTHAARPEKAGIIAAGSWLACCVAMAVHARGVQQARRRYRRKSWAMASYAYIVTVGPAGVRAAFTDHTTEMAWCGFVKVELWAEFILLWSKSENPLPIPVHALPDGWSASDLAAGLSLQVRHSAEPA